MPTTWNPADLLNTTLSGSNLTATFAGGLGSTRSIYSDSSGKYYFEVRINSPSSASVGLALVSVALSSLAFFGVGPSPVAGAVAAVQAGYIYVGTSLAGGVTGGFLANGDVLQIAVDLTAKRFWARLNTLNWNNTAGNDPATGVGGIDITAVATGALYAFCGGNTGSGTTANFGSSAFTYIVPTGFTAGFGPAAVGGAAQARAMVLA